MRWLVVACLCLAFVASAGCAGGAVQVSVADGERAANYRGTQVVQYYKWWADLAVRNTTGETVYTTLDGITYEKGQDVVQAQTAEADGKLYARPGWGEAGRKGALGRPDERIAIPAGGTAELKNVGFESHPESTNGTIRVMVEGQGAAQSAPVDFMSFKSR